MNRTHSIHPFSKKRFRIRSESTGFLKKPFSEIQLQSSHRSVRHPEKPVQSVRLATHPRSKRCDKKAGADGVERFNQSAQNKTLACNRRLQSGTDFRKVYAVFAALAIKAEYTTPSVEPDPAGVARPVGNMYERNSFQRPGRWIGDVP